MEVAASSELLNNVDFEQLSAGLLRVVCRGDAVGDGTGTQGHESRTAVHADEDDYLVQRVPVQSGVIYLLRNFTRAAKPGQFARLQINWVNRRGGNAVDIQVVPTETNWRAHTIAAMAPADAIWADV